MLLVQLVNDAAFLWVVIVEIHQSAIDLGLGLQQLREQRRVIPQVVQQRQNLLLYRLRAGFYIVGLVFSNVTAVSLTPHCHGLRNALEPIELEPIDLAGIISKI